MLSTGIFYHKLGQKSRETGDLKYEERSTKEEVI